MRPLPPVRRLDGERRSSCPAEACVLVVEDADLGLLYGLPNVAQLCVAMYIRSDPQHG